MDFIKQLIKQLQENEKPFGLMSEEMQAKAKGIGIVNFSMFSGRIWESRNETRLWTTSITYRLRADYTELVDDEYETLEIEKGVHGLMIRKPTSIVYLHELIDDPNYAGCLYEDGNIGPMPPMYSVKGSTNRGYFAPFEDLKAGNAHIHKATHVVFKK